MDASVGESARCMVRAADAAGIPNAVVPLMHAALGGQRGEHRVVVHLASAHLHVLMHPGGIARRIRDVAQPAGGGVVPDPCE